MVFFAIHTSTKRFTDKYGDSLEVDLPWYEKLLQTVFIVLEWADILGDFTYLLYFPHSSVVIIWVICFSIFVPIGASIIALNAERNYGVSGSLKYYYGFAVYGNCNPVFRILVVVITAVFENLVQMLCLLVDSFSLGTRWSAFQAGKAILGFILYSKSVGEIIGVRISVGAPMLAAVLIVFVPLYILPSLMVYYVFA